MFYTGILIFTIFWIVLAFIQKLKMGLWCLGYILLIGGNVFLYNGVPLWGYVCVFAGIGCIIWFVIMLRKQYDKYKYQQ